jgi:translation initiation factor 1 (eIF-1/SUI1)
MNPFENENEEETKVLVTTNITIWKTTRGRKTNTYITGWNIEESVLKDYLQQFKRTKGCNGSLKKEKDEDDNEIEGYTLHFQGDKIDSLIEFMISKGVNKDIITLKGC